MDRETHQAHQDGGTTNDVGKAAPVETLALWSAIGAERRALDERTTAGAGRFGWPQEEDRDATALRIT